MPYLGQDVGALLQQGHGRFAQAGGELNSKQLFLLSEVVLESMGQGHGSTPVRQGVC